MEEKTIIILVNNKKGEYACKITEDGCWIWPSLFQQSGYGRLKINGKTFVAHRVVFEMKKYSIPDGYELDHLCRVRACVNPDHLEPVTRFENQKRGDTFTRKSWFQTICINGHPLFGDNLVRLKTGHRRCRQCERDRQKKIRSTDEYRKKHAEYERHRRKRRKEERDG